MKTPTTNHTYYGTHNIPGYELNTANHNHQTHETIAAAIATATRNLYTTAHRGRETLDPTTLHIKIRYRNGTDDLQITATANAHPRREPA